MKSRAIKILVAVVALALIAAGCNSTSSEAQVLATAELVEQVADLQAILDHAVGELPALEAAVGSAEAALGGFIDSAGVHAIDRTAGIPDPPDGQVAVRISFGYLPDQVPGSGIQVYDTLPEVSTVWAMESLAAGAALPVGEPVPLSTVFLAPGEKVRVALAYENPSDAAVSFMAVPHQDSPGALNGMIWPQCLCFSYAYEAPAGGSWYRVIELTASPDIPIGSKVDILWTMLTDSSVFPDA